MVCKNRGTYEFLGPWWVLINLALRNSVEYQALCLSKPSLAQAVVKIPYYCIKTSACLKNRKGASILELCCPQVAPWVRITFEPLHTAAARYYQLPPCPKI